MNIKPNHMTDEQLFELMREKSSELYMTPYDIKQLQYVSWSYHAYNHIMNTFAPLLYV